MSTFFCRLASYKFIFPVAAFFDFEAAFPSIAHDFMFELLEVSALQGTE